MLKNDLGPRRRPGRSGRGRRRRALGPLPRRAAGRPGGTGRPRHRQVRAVPDRQERRLRQPVSKSTSELGYEHCVDLREPDRQSRRWRGIATPSPAASTSRRWRGAPDFPRRTFARPRRPRGSASRRCASRGSRCCSCCSGARRTTTSARRSSSCPRTRACRRASPASRSWRWATARRTCRRTCTSWRATPSASGPAWTPPWARSRGPACSSRRASPAW